MRRHRWMWRRRWRWTAGTLGVMLGLCACASASGDAGARPPDKGTGTGRTSGTAPGGPSIGRVLVFTRTAGFRHQSIADGRAAFERLAAAHGFTVDLTEDPAVFTPAGLAPYRVVVFLHTTGHVLEAPGQAALEGWLARGNGWVGVHGAADGDNDWAWYVGLVGARFASHPEIQPATVRVVDRTHPATSMLPAAWQRTDEWYDFDRSPRGRVRVLATMDERSYRGGRMGADHPIAWCHAYGGGRAFYTALGHTEASWTEAAFLDHVLGGVRWAAGAEPDAACDPG